MKEVLSFGAGVQSTTLLLMSCKGKLIRKRPEPRKLKLPNPQTVYALGELCLIKGLMPGMTFNGVITCLSPMRAKVTDADPIWHGAEVSKGIRKASELF